MRFEPRFSRLPVALVTRSIERGARFVEVSAPAGWTTPRIESWLDWAANEPGDLPADAEPLMPATASPLDGALDRWAGRLAAWGVALGRIKNADRETFAQELTATVLLGLAAPGPRLAGGARVHPLTSDSLPPAGDRPHLRLGEADTEAAIQARWAERRAHALAGDAVRALADRLAEVAVAVTRCEDPSGGSADPARNPALARAALAARRAGASDADILADAGLGSRAFVEAEHVVAGDPAFDSAVELVGAVERGLEHFHRHRDERGMGDPGAVMAVARLALLVGADLGEGGRIRRLVALDRDLGGHAAHREGAAAVAGLDQLERISGEEGLIHRHRRAVRG